MAEKKPTSSKKATRAQPALSITASREGFRRAGRAFGREATVIPLAELSKDEIALLLGETMLTIGRVEIEIEAAVVEAVAETGTGGAE